MLEAAGCPVNGKERRDYLRRALEGFSEHGYPPPWPPSKYSLKKPTDLSEFKLIKGMVEQHKDKFTEHQIRWWLRDREENGLDECVVKIGKRLYVHQPSFLRWFISKNH